MERTNKFDETETPNLGLLTEMSYAEVSLMQKYAVTFQGTAWLISFIPTHVLSQLQQRLNLLRQLEEEEEEMRRQLIFDAKVDMPRFDV